MDHDRDPVSQKQGKTARGRLFGSLASRVLSISFVFVVVPLILYSIFVYTRVYERKLYDVFHELSLYEQDQLTFIDEIEKFNLNFLSALHSILNEAHYDKDYLSDVVVDSVLRKFANHTNLSAISFLRVGKNNQLICSHSTYDEYEGKDFTKYFSLTYLEKEKDSIFIAKDPLFGHSLFMSYLIKDKRGKVHGVVVASIALDKLVKLLDSKRSLFDTSITIIGDTRDVLASTLHELKGKTFSLGLEGDVVKEEVPVYHDSSLRNSFRFSIGDQTRLCVISHIPHSESYIMISVPEKIVLSQVFAYIWHLILFLLFILVVGGIGAYLFTLRLSRPLRSLENVMTSVGKGELDQRFHRDALGFEINYLGERFNNMVVSLIDHIETAKRERASKEAYAKELQIGHEIQQSILPQSEESFPGIEVGVYFNPAKEVAGDFYDWMIQGHKVMMTIADGVGKGVSSALYSFDLRSILRTYASTNEDLEQIIRETNRLFLADTKESGNFVTAFIAIFDSSAGKLNFVNCGHNHPIVKHESGELGRLVSTGLAFGVEEFDEVNVGEMLLTHGDFVVFFTDGISEAQNPEEKQFGEPALEKVIQESKAETPDQLIQEILSAINDFTQGADQYDDMTLIVFKTDSFKSENP